MALIKWPKLYVLDIVDDSEIWFCVEQIESSALVNDDDFPSSLSCNESVLKSTKWFRFERHKRWKEEKCFSFVLKRFDALCVLLWHQFMKIYREEKESKTNSNFTSLPSHLSVHLAEKILPTPNCLLIAFNFQRKMFFAIDSLLENFT